MKHTMRRLLALLLSAATVLGAMGIPALAAGENDTLPEARREVTHTVTEEIRITEPQEDGLTTYRDETVSRTFTTLETYTDPGDIEGMQEYTFASFEELKALLYAVSGPYNMLVYTGNAPLVITEDITAPDNVHLVFPEDTHVTIPEGVTLTAAQLDAGTLEVKGTLRSLGGLRVCNALIVTGQVELHGVLSVHTGASVTGMEHIHLLDHGKIHWHKLVRDFAQLAALCQEAQGSSNDYTVNLVPEKDLTLEQSLVVPANIMLDMTESDSCVTIAKDVTLELEGFSYCSLDMVIHGTLKLYEDFVYEGSSMVFTETGRLSGRGSIYLGIDPEISSARDYTDIITGLDPETILAEKRTMPGMITWRIQDITGKTRLSTPTGLLWNHKYESTWDETRKEYVDVPVEAIGHVAWITGELVQDYVEVQFYRVGENGYDEHIYGVSHTYNRPFMADSSYDFVDLDYIELETGDYYFTVQALGDGENYADSQIAKSDIWHYEKPDATLEDCTNLRWDWPNCLWTGPEENVLCYDVRVTYRPTATGKPTDGINVTGCYSEQFKVFDHFLENYGAGYYSFSVKALSSDITKVCSGGWSLESEPYLLGDPSETVNIPETLGTIAQQAASMRPEEIRKAVQELDTGKLEQSMKVDRGSSGVVKTLEELEAAVGGGAAIEVNKEAVDFKASQIGVVGASLNDVVDTGEFVTLVVDKPEKDHVLDTMYDNAVAVRFSMTLSNVADTKNLEVPVMITLPIPKDINPDFLVILHYARDGGAPEQVMPHIFREGAQWYASFVLTSFSDFVMTQTAQEPEPEIITTPMYRLYNPNSGEHFYTGSTEERDMLASVGWQYEGVAWNAPTNAGESVYRLFNPNSGDHHYTMSAQERDMLVGYGWQYEGVCWNSASSDNLPLYRLYNPNADCGSHHYTGSTEERDMLVGVGWIYEGIGWFGTLH